VAPPFPGRPYGTPGTHGGPSCHPGPARPYAAAGSAERAHVPVALADRTAARAGRVAVTGEVCVPPCRAVPLRCAEPELDVTGRYAILVPSRAGAARGSVSAGVSHAVRGGRGREWCVPPRLAVLPDLPWRSNVGATAC
jgi:hypothetical protein